ncbi:bifunctional folylpolyglutamate synthase/dihydrofolate synthase [Granulicella arctica]|uniref:Dihydrofolate synthase/folylpolyglutamate synthase n=1 Tax=Granulicella arctica TaxID=940613 RepID=A0A7Y9PEV8_9BACT|nr:folylpolyglutamate synthase/dihydrofolate synthase family protein [Granulicella arctica]NYF78637.1 dihydrofolate synthase/folylpolyglutamate synthase [Granulicella arctica]
MTSTYAAAVDHLYALGHELAPPAPNADGTTPPRRKFDLAHMRILAQALDAPQQTFPSILIAGTNGKGSTAATLSSILTAAGYRTALYTSPHLTRVNERIQIDGLQIDDEDFARHYFHVDNTAQRLVTEEKLPHAPSFFEILTAVAFVYFSEQKVDIAVLEVGLGGRLDATNIVEPLLSLLTDIALDHQDYLGNTIAAITREKCGILRPNGTLITLPQHPEANQAIGEAAANLNLRAISATPYIPHTPVAPNIPTALLHPTQKARVPHPSRTCEGWDESKDLHLPSSTAPKNSVILSEAKDPCISSEQPQPLTQNHYTITLDNEPLEVNSPLPGQHQQRNIALAIAAAQELRNSHSYKLTNTAISEGIKQTHWPGRLELIQHEGSQDLLLDVAHNPAGAWTLRAAIAQLPEDRPRTLIFSCLRDKSLAEMSRILFPLFDSSPDADPARRHDHLIVTHIANPRASSLEELLAAAHALSIPAHAAPHIAAALAQARAITPPNGLILATGSVYLIGDLRNLAVSE